MSGQYTYDDLYALDGESVTNLMGQELAVTVQDDAVLIGGAAINEADIPATNGMIHIMDGVLAEGN